MKLTEKQLAELFTSSTQAHQATFDAGDCLNAVPASSNRLLEAEKILNDFNSAQGMKMAFSFKEWSEIVAKSIDTSQKSWFSFLGFNSPLKTSIATFAFAVAFVFTMQPFTTSERAFNPVNQNLSSDIIRKMPFEGDSDQLSRGTFDAAEPENDSLFNASFG